MDIENFSCELKKVPMTGGFVDQIELLKKRYGKEYKTVATELLELCKVLNIDPVKTARRYIYDYLKQLDYFIKNKEYGHSDYDEIRENIYDNEKVMLETYMPGLLLSYSYTTILYEKNHLFLNAFVPKIIGGMKGVEIGFGEGFYIWELLKNTTDTMIHGFDISLSAINFANKLLLNSEIDNSRYTLEFGNIFDGLPLENGNMDFAILAEVIEHIPNPEIGIKEVSRVLKTGGYLYITTVIDSNHMDHISNFESPQVVRKMIEDQGLKVLDCIEYHMTDDFPESKDISIGLAFVACKG